MSGFDELRENEKHEAVGGFSVRHERTRVSGFDEIWEIRSKGQWLR